MKVLFLCKASTETGLGHLIRSRSLAIKFHQNLRHVGEVKFIGIGTRKIIGRLLGQSTFETDIVDNEQQIQLEKLYDIIFFDMLTIEEKAVNYLKQYGKFLVSISPIFNCMKEMDLLFHRSKHINLSEGNVPKKILASLKYAVIQENCSRISTARYEENLENQNFPIAISMGGGDAANKTLTLLKSLKNCKIPATFWVMLGEGYQYSYDSLINEIGKDSQHEIILAKTNKSMWEILKNCVFAILPGGITTYEAAYAGLPTINFSENPGKEFIIRELLEEQVCLLAGDLTSENLNNLNDQLKTLYNDRVELMKMHLNSKKVLDGKGADRIFEFCQQMVNENALVEKKSTV